MNFFSEISVIVLAWLQEYFFCFLVIILSVRVQELRRYMLLAYDKGMTRGEYVFWSLEYRPNHDWVYGNESWIGNDGRNEEARQAMNAVFHVRHLDLFITSINSIFILLIFIDAISYFNIQ